MAEEEPARARGRKDNERCVIQNIIIYGVSRYQRKVLPATPSCAGCFPEPSSALSTHSIRTAAVGTVRADVSGD